MNLEIDFGNPVFDEKNAGSITVQDLDDFYAASDEIGQMNLFFELEASFHHYLEAGNARLAAHLAFLTAYYLFTPLTPPASCELALHYIKEALRLNPLPDYLEWQQLMERGN